MKTMVRIAALTAALAMSSAFAQEEKAPNSKLIIIEGSVLLNQGEQFADAVIDTPTKEGDRVMAMEKARAVIQFDDGCDLEVDPGTIVTVPDKSPCAGAIVSVEQVAPTGTVAGGSTLLTPRVIIPATIIAACLAIDAGDDKLNCKDDPASP